MGTCAVGMIVLCCVGLAVRSIIRDKKKGKASCGGDCSRCRGCRLIVYRGVRKKGFFAKETFFCAIFQKIINKFLRFALLYALKHCGIVK